jgi:hypothetical protein
VITALLTALTGVMHDLIAWPLEITVHEPH